MIFRTSLVTILLCTAGGAIHAQEVGDTSVGIGSTNFGLALQGEYIAAPQVGVRGMLMGGFNIDDTFEVDEGTIDGEASIGGAAVLADYYPLANPWRISGGLFFSNTEVTGEVSDSGITYDGEITLANEIAPLITTGFNAAIAPGWTLSGDVGFIVSSLEVSSDDAAAADEVDDLNEQLEDIPVLPFVGFAVSYSF